MLSSFLCQSLLANISTVILALEFYHLACGVSAVQSLFQRGSARRHIQNPAAVREDISIFSTSPRMINLHAFELFRLRNPMNPLPIFDLAGILLRHQHHRRRRVRSPFESS